MVRQLAMGLIIGLILGSAIEWALFKWQAVLLVKELEYDLNIGRS